MTTPLQDYYDRLAAHDWMYDYSDDHRVWQKGSNERRALRATVSISPEHAALYHAYALYMHNKGPKPERPTE